MHSGIDNPGTLCYMISIIQQLSMMPSFRDSVVASWMDIGDAESTCNEREIEHHLISELQGLFVGTNSTFQPVKDIFPFYSAYQSLHQHAVRLEEQKDASDFLVSFLQLLDNIYSSPEIHCPMSLSPSAALRGELYHELTATEGLKKESKENFYFISLTVAGAAGSDLESSLEYFIKPEVFDFKWRSRIETHNLGKDIGQPIMLPTRKTVSFHRLPPHLIFHLRRFEFDLEKLEQKKVNKRFRFPIDLDMSPYLRSNRTDSIYSSTIKSCDIAKIYESSRCGTTAHAHEPVPASSIQHTQQDEHDGVNISPSDQEEVEECVSDDEYEQEENCAWYELAGVVIHKGTAHDGHYYSIVRDRDSGQWLRMDDDLVEEFDIEDLAEVAFGGRRSEREEEQEEQQPARGLQQHDESQQQECHQRLNQLRDENGISEAIVVNLVDAAVSESAGPAAKEEIACSAPPSSTALLKSVDSSSNATMRDEHSGIDCKVDAGDDPAYYSSGRASASGTRSGSGNGAGDGIGGGGGGGSGSGSLVGPPDSTEEDPAPMGKRPKRPWKTENAMILVYDRMA